MNFFDYIKNESFFKPFTLKYRRIYYDCIQLLIDKTKELPVLYESDAKDSITMQLKNVDMQKENKFSTENVNNLLDDTPDESSIELQAPAILSLFRNVDGCCQGR